MNIYNYIRAVLLALILSAIGALIVNANLVQAEEPKGNIDAIISVLQKAQKAGVTTVIIMTTTQNDGQPVITFYPIDVVGVIPTTPPVVGILMIVGKDT
jgi:hypothetical protein